MGSSSFADYYEGTDLQKLYNDAVEAARYEHGSDPYSGTIATTSGVRLVQAQPVPLQVAHDIADASLDSLSKWDDCGAVPILDTGNVDKREVTFDVTLLGPGEFYERKGDLEAAVRQAAKLRAGETLIDWEVERPVGQGRWNGTTIYSGRQTSVQRKVTVEATEGKTETRYVVQGPGIHQRQWKDMHPTQAAARKSLKEWLEAGHGAPRHLPDSQFPRPHQDYEVVGITRRVDGEPVVRGYAEIVKTTYPIQATVGKITNSGKISGYLIFGWAAC